MKSESFLQGDPENLPPKLEQMKGHNPFSAPEGYFDQLQDSIQSAIVNLPDFESVSKTQPFETPEGYFEKLPLAIRKRIEAEEQTPAWKEWLQILLRPGFSVAFASVALLCILGVKYFTREIVVQSPQNFISSTDLSNSGLLSDMDDTMLYEALDGENSTAENTSEDNSAIEQYLIDNDIDPTQLESHL